MVISLELKMMSSLRQCNNLCAHKSVTEPGAVHRVSFHGELGDNSPVQSLRKLYCMC